MVRLTGQFLNILSRCKKMGEQKVRLFPEQPSVLFIDVIVNKYFHINLQQVKLEDKNQDQLSHCSNWNELLDSLKNWNACTWL